MNYATIDQALNHIIAYLEEDLGPEKVRVPMPSTIRLLGRLNAACARNMIATNFFPTKNNVGAMLAATRGKPRLF